MFPRLALFCLFLPRLPHAGGGVSGAIHAAIDCRKSSPRRWGCFPLVFPLTERCVVFPTQVGVFPIGSYDQKLGTGLPHAGGGVSTDGERLPLRRGSSPRRWGCFSVPQSIHLSTVVFPTQVGVFLSRTIEPKRAESLPHAGGGVSVRLLCSALFTPSSPRRWGCSHAIHDKATRYPVFPTQVGVFLAMADTLVQKPSLPHAGGGVSTQVRL